MHFKRIFAVGCVFCLAVVLIGNSLCLATGKPIKIPAKKVAKFDPGPPPPKKK